MQTLKRMAEWYLDVASAGPGQGTSWSFSTQSPWPVWMPDWLVLIAGICGIVYIAYVYRRDAASLPLGRLLPLLMLRIAAVALLLVFLSGVTLSIDRTGLPTVVVMIDDSASMGLEDRYSETESQRAAAVLMASSGGDAATRINLAKSLLTRRDARFLKALLEDHKLRVYRFSETATPVGDGEYLQANQIEELAEKLKAIEAGGSQTRPGPAVRKVLDDLRGTPPTAIVVISDGIATTTDADRLSSAADLLADKLVPVYAIGIGSEEPARDLQLYDLLVDEVAFVDDPIIFSARLKTFGFEDEEVTMTLREVGSSEVLASRRVPAADGAEPIDIELAYVPPVEGEFDYTLEVSPHERETNRDNNSETRHVSVRRERMRVLLADSRPRYEFRYLKHLLEREKTIQLHTVLQDSDIEYSAEDETVLDHLPVKREELLEYDVIVLGDLNPDFLSSAVYENLSDFVRDSGGGMILIAGTRFNPIAYRDTPLEPLVPVQLGADAQPAPLPITEGFRPVLTIEGLKGSNIFRFADSEQESLNVWNQLPELYWMFRAPKLKPGAVAFAEHPAGNPSEGRLPVVAMQQFGAGKVLFHATDEFYRWRYRQGDTYYGRYWVSAIRYLSRSKQLGKDRAAELSTDRVVYQIGETARLRVRFLDARLAPAESDGVAVMVEHRTGTQQRVTLSRLPESPVLFEGSLGNLPEGSYHAWVVAPAFRDAPPSVDFRVEVPHRELEKRSLDRADLVQTGQITRGGYYSLAEAGDVPGDIPAGQAVPLETRDPIPLWNRWELLLLFTTVLTSEWLLRKRARLL